jgi:hypothetical protein
MRTCTAPPEQLESLPSHERELALLQLFAGVAERFEPGAAGAVTATVACEVDDRPRAFDRFLLRIEHGRCAVVREDRGGRGQPAAVTLSLGAADLARLVTGRASASQLFLRQRLRVTGDVLLASRLHGLFSVGDAA